MKLLNPLPQRLDTGATPTFAGLLAGDGTAAAPSISFSADSDTGFYRSSTGNVRFSSNGTDALQISNTGITLIPGGINAGYIANVGAGGGLALVALGTNQNITLTPSGTGWTQAFGGTSAGAAFAAVNSNFVSGSTGSALFIGFGAATGDTYARLQASRAGNSAIANLVLNPTGGNILIGTVSDSGALLQVGTDLNTTANGMVFGTGLFLHRSSANSLTINTAAVANAALTLVAGSGVSIAAVQVDASNAYFDSQKTGSGIVLRTNGTTTALTLDSSQNATFAQRVRTADGTLALPGHSFGNDTASGMYRAATNTLGFSSGGVLSLTLDGYGAVVCGPAALGTTTTDGFFYLRAMAGAPTGVPTAYTGRVAATYDSTNNKLYIYNGAWKSVTLT